MLNTDKPITKRGEDFLNRKVFADNISTAIKNYDNNSDSLAIGLYGKWGAGKTSIVNMITEVLDTDENIIVFKFEPWIYSDTQQLISHFFREFAKAVKHKDHALDAIRVGEELETYATFFKPMSLIPEPTVSLMSLASSKVLGGVGKAAKRWGKLKTKNISSTKESIEKHLLKLDKKILIVIDDIDRLNNTEIRQVFQMIKILGNFPNTIYMAVMDREVVVDALSEVQKGDGSEYLEKIIHVPFQVPAISQSDVLDFLIKNINELLVDSDVDDTYLGNIFHSGFKYFFKNIRDVKRYMNILKFNYLAIGKELNGADLMAITVIQVFEPKVYDNIRKNKEVFIGNVVENENEHAKNELENIFSLFNNISQGIGREFIENIFPEVISIFGGTEYVGFGSSYRKEARVCSEDFFDVYFQFTLDENEIINSDMKKYIEMASNEEQFRDIIESFISNNKITRFLERLQDYTEYDISEDKFQVIFDVLMDVGDKFPKRETRLFMSNNDMQVMRILNQLSKRLENKDDRFILFEKAIKKSKDSIWMVCYEIIIQMQQHGESGEKDSRPEHKQTLSNEKLQELKNIVKKKIEEWTKCNRLFEHQNGIGIWKLWEELDKENADKYKIEQLKDNNQLLRVLEKYINIRYSYGSGDYVEIKTETFDYDGFKKFIDINIIAEQVKMLSKNFDKYETTDKSRFVIDGFLKEYHAEDVSKLS